MPEGEEKSFPATPKRREEARKKGQVARSAELGAAATLLALILALHVLLPGDAGLSLLRDTQAAFRFGGHDALTFGDVQRWQMTGLLWAGRLLLPTLLLALALGLAVGVGQVGFHIAPEALAPQWQRVNPASGLKRLFSLRGTVELVKSLLKLLFIGGVCYGALHGVIASGEMLGLTRKPLPEALGVVGGLLWMLGLRVAVALFILAIADYAYQKYDHEKNLRMSMSEIKQEMKQSEGDPQVKARVRRLQREMSKRRMMQDVPKATVVITNPTHYAVALHYEHGMGAPKVLAKGQDEIARRIKEIAQENNVPLVENKPLAQTLYRTVEIGDEIPADLYEAVAQVLAFVFRTYSRRPRRQSTPG
ncbi:MAG: flagellar biosynthesis protein FlhB [Armatimonadetes bacterium]|nr:flagellar biosynthesis protein FlhB [Armatimonadota bacterium]